MEPFTMSPDQKGIETGLCAKIRSACAFTMSPDQKGIETRIVGSFGPGSIVHNEPRSKGD